MCKNKIIVVDIDGVLTSEISGDNWGNYHQRTPNLTQISRVNNLHDKGYKIYLYTSRLSEDYHVTKKWLEDNNIKYSSLLLNKPLGELSIDDKSIPTCYLPDLQKYLSYDFHRSCWRYKNGNISSSEEHKCFFCKTPIPLTSNECLECGIMPCPNCGKCLCNIPLLSKITLIRIHEKYCCNLDKFDGQIILNGFVDNDIIKNCEDILMECKKYEVKQ
jgi:hypothetical protein